MTLINKFFHSISHFLKQNAGKVVTWQEGGSVYVGFECSGCKVVDPESIVCCSIKKESEIVNE